MKDHGLGTQIQASQIHVLMWKWFYDVFIVRGQRKVISHLETCIAETSVRQSQQRRESPA